MRDLHNNIEVKQALETIVVNNDSEGTGDVVDLAGYEAAELIVDVGESGDTLSGSVYFDLILKEGDASDGSGMTAVAEADVLGDWATGGIFATVDAAAEDGAVFHVGYIGSKRYIRLYVDVTGTHTNGTPIGAVVVCGRARHLGGATV
jgi:hypothetical protein